MKKEELSVGEIYDLIQSFNTSYQDLFSRMDDDFNLWTLESYELDKYADNITFNEPRVFADAVMQILEAAKLSISIQRRDKDEKKEAKTERFLFACFDEIDEQLLSRGFPALKSHSIWTACLRGFIAGRFLYRSKPECLPYDPRWLTYEVDNNGPCWSGYQTWRSPYAIKQEYERTFKALEGKEKHEPIKITDFWDKGKNVVIVGDNQQNIEPAANSKHKLDRPPVVIVPIGSSPMVLTTDDRYAYVKHWGESIYAGGRGLFKELSKILSIWMSVAGKSREPSGFIITPDARLVIEQSPYGKSQWTTLPEGSQVQPLEPPDIASSIPNLYEIISQAVQRADFVWLKYGQLWKGQELSSVAISELKQGADKVLTPVLVGLGRYFKQASRLLIDQYKQIGEPIQVKGLDSKGREFEDVVMPEDLEGDYVIDTQFVSITPEEEASNYAKAQMVKQSQLAPDSFIRRQLIKFQDPSKIEQDTKVEMAEQLSPRIRLTRIITALQEAGKPEEAMMMTIELQKLIAMEAQQFGMGGQPPQGQPPAPPEPVMQPPSGGENGNMGL